MFLDRKRPRRRPARLILSTCLIAFVFMLGPAGRLLAGTATQSATEPDTGSLQFKGPPLIYHLKLDRMVDGIMVTYVRRGLEQAQKDGAGLIVLEIDTFGGVAASSVDLSEMLNASTIPTVAWVKKGGSAGALITYACDDIVVAPGANFGAAVVISITPGGEPSPVEEKFTRFYAQQMRANAEANGHDPDLAEAMTDVAKEILYDDYARKMADRGIQLGIPEQYRRAEAAAGPRTRAVGGVAGEPPWQEYGKEYIVKKDEVLSLTDYEALFLHVAIGRATVIDAGTAVPGGPAAKVEAITDIPKFAAFRGARIVTVNTSWSEGLSAFLTLPGVTILLILGTIIGISTELKVPGFGAPGILGIVCIALLFIGHMGAGAARWTDLILLVVGLVLLGVELFVIPGFGIVGITGIILIVAALFMMLVQNPPPGVPALPGQIWTAVWRLGLAIIGSAVAILLLYRFVLPHTPIFGALVLTTQQQHKAGFHASEGSELAEPEKLIGLVGVAKTKLRPAGKGLFGGEPLDVVTDGDFIDAGATVEIVEVESNRIVVRQVQPPQAREPRKEA
jgi:membrane-bound serine protease (ClpP class)